MLNKQIESTPAARGVQAVGVVGHSRAVGEALTLAACGPYTSAVAVLDDAIVMISAGNVGLPVATTRMPLPPGGHAIVALDANGPSCVLEDGSFYVWARGNSRWERVGNLLETSE